MGSGFWELDNLIYGLLLVSLQIVLINLIIKHRESKESIANYLMVAPSAIFMLVIIKNVSTPLPASILLALLMLIPIHCLDKYKRYIEA